MSASFHPAAGRAFAPYGGFANARADGAAEIARLVGADRGASMGCGVAVYRRVRTTWELPFDEVICVLSGAMTVRAGGREWAAGPGDVLFFPRGAPVEYDVGDEAAVFYATCPPAGAA